MSFKRDPSENWLTDVGARRAVIKEMLSKERRQRQELIQSHPISINLIQSGGLASYNASRNQEAPLDPEEEAQGVGQVEEVLEDEAVELETTQNGEAGFEEKEEAEDEGESFEEDLEEDAVEHEDDSEEYEEHEEKGSRGEKASKEEEAKKEEEKEAEENDAGGDTEEKADYLDLDDFEAPKKLDSLEEMYQKEMEIAAEAAKGPITVEAEEEEEPQETDEDIIRDLKCELDELEEDRNEVELMIDFYEHRLAHGCLLKGLGTKGRGTDDGGPVRPKDEPSTGLLEKLHEKEEGENFLQTRFNQLLKQVDKTRMEFAENLEKLRTDINGEIQTHKWLTHEVNDEIKEFNNHRRNIAESAIFVDSNRVIDMKEIERHEQTEEIRRQEIWRLRLRNVCLRNACMDKEAEVKTGINYEEMEQIMLQNQLLKNRIEQKAVNNEKVKENLMRKIGCITHVKQKTDMHLDELSNLTSECQTLDMTIQRVKEDLTHLRKVKDHFRKTLEVQRRDNGVLGQDSLLRDMENQFDSEDEQQQTLKTLVERTNAIDEETSQYQEMIKALEILESL